MIAKKNNQFIILFDAQIGYGKSYVPKMLAEEADSTKGFKFVWITDGKGWYSAKRNLKETFDILPTLYNINDLKNGALDKLLS